MIGANRGVAMERTKAMRSGRWDLVGGLLVLSTALGLWVFVLVGVAAPLGDAVALLDAAGPAQPPTQAYAAACTIPPDAIAQGPDVLASAEAGVVAFAGRNVARPAARNDIASAARKIIASIRNEAIAMAPPVSDPGTCR